MSDQRPVHPDAVRMATAMRRLRNAANGLANALDDSDNVLALRRLERQSGKPVFADWAELADRYAAAFEGTTKAIVEAADIIREIRNDQ